MDNIIAIITITVLILIIIFLVFREINSWYWKINERIDLQKEGNLTLKNILKELQKSTKLKKMVDEGNVVSDGILAEAGIIVSKDPNGEHGLLCSSYDLGIANWDNADKLCKNYKGGGFSDWRLPEKGELQLLYFYLHTNGQGNFLNELYWSSTEFDKDGNIWVQNFDTGSPLYLNLTNTHINVRAVRTF
jgi:hypothetical protein